MTETELPETLQDLLTTALAHGVDSLAEGAPVVPFVLLERGEGPSLHRFWTGELAQSLEQAREWLREQEGLRMACVVWDAYLTTDGQDGQDGEQVDAICADGCDDSGAQGWIAAQRYVPAGAEQGWAASGAPVLLGRSTPVFGS